MLDVAALGGPQDGMEHQLHGRQVVAGLIAGLQPPELLGHLDEQAVGEPGKPGTPWPCPNSLLMPVMRTDFV